MNRKGGINTWRGYSVAILCLFPILTHAFSNNSFLCSTFGFITKPLGLCWDEVVTTTPAPRAPLVNETTTVPLPTLPAISYAPTPDSYTNNYITYSNKNTITHEYLEARLRLLESGLSQSVQPPVQVNSASSFSSREFVYKNVDSLHKSLSDRIKNIDVGSSDSILANPSISGLLSFDTYSANRLMYTSGGGVLSYATDLIIIDDSFLIGTTTVREKLTVASPIYISNSSPTTTQNRLYASAGDLYWSGNMIGGVSTSSWSITGGDVYRLSGNVGIGTTSPREKVEIFGGSLQFGDTSNTAHGLKFERNGVQIGSISSSNNNLTLTGGSTFGIAHLVIDSAGNVGVGGDNTPTNKLDVHGAMRIGVGFNNFSAPSNGLIVEGNVGIGTTTPAYKLHVSGGDVLVQNTTGARAFLFLGDTTSGLVTAQRIASDGDKLELYTNSTRRITIAASGNVGIGTTSPSVPLDVNGIIRTNSYLNINSVGYIRSTPGILNIQGGTTATNFSNNANNTILMSILDGGNVGIGTSTPGARLDLDAGGVRVFGDIRTDAQSDTLTFLGVGAGDANLVTGVINQGLYNTFFGYRSGSENTIGFGNTANGYNSGRFLADGLTPNTNSSNSLFLGYNTRSGVATSTNEIVIGANAVGAGPNSVTLGNDSIVTTVLRGNVGIGLTGPSAKLSVRGNGAGSGLLAQFTDSFSAAKFTILDNGNVGIGTTTPVSILTIVGDTDLNGDLLLSGAFYDRFDSAGTSGMILKTTGTSTEWVATSTLGLGGVSNYLSLTDTQSSFTANRLVFTNSGGSALTDSADLVFTSSRFGIGTTTPNATLSVVGSGSYDAFSIASSTGVLLFNIVASGNVGIGTSTPSEILTVAGTIQSTALLGGSTNLTTDASGNIIRDPSDVRLKQNITTLDNALNIVLGLRGVRYEWIDKARFGEQLEIGFIAQEVDSLVPEVVQKGGEYWSLNTKNLVAVVVEAIKEIWKEITGQNEKIADLEARIEYLESRQSLQNYNGNNNSTTNTSNVEEETTSTEVSTSTEDIIEPSSESNEIIDKSAEEETVDDNFVTEETQANEPETVVTEVKTQQVTDVTTDTKIE